MSQHSTFQWETGPPASQSSFSRPVFFTKNRNFTTFLLFVCWMLAGQVNAQLTGTKTIPGDYATIAAAVTDLNAAGVGAGGVTFNVAAGHTELLAGRITLTATGTMANPIVFQKSGAGANPVLTAYTGVHPTGDPENDGMFCLSGSDWVTIDGIDLQEAGANMDETTTMEYGYALFKTSETDGCQNNTIKNCTITLNRINNGNWATGSATNGSVGIVINNSLVASVGTGLTISSPDGTSSFNKFYSNTIRNCNTGMAFDGYNAPSPFDLADQGNDIGGNSPATGNTILNYGGGGTTNGAAGIYTIRQWDVNCSYNTINNNDGGGINHGLTLWGILLQTATSSNATCNNNSITVHGGATTSATYGIQITVGSTAAGNTIDVQNNTVTGDYLTATSGAFYGINCGSTASTVNLINNTVANTSYGSNGTTSSGVNYLIYNASGATNVNATGNTVTNHSRVGTSGGTTVGIYIASGANQTVKNNSISTLSIDGTGTASTMYGIQTTTSTVVVDSNIVNDLKCLKSTGTSALYGIYNGASPTNENFNYNTVSNLRHNGTGTTYGIFTNTTTGTRTLSNNLVYTVSGGGTTVAGIAQTTSSPNVFNNKIYDIQSNSSGAPTVSGLLVTSLGTAGTANIFNNLIGDIKAPAANTSANTAPSVRGINITVTTTNSNVNLSFNTVHLDATSSGTDFSTAALFVSSSATATTANLTLKNNAFVNNSVPNGAGQSVAFQRSTTSVSNYSDESNNNLFYAGTPGASNLIFFDGTTANQTIEAFKLQVTPRESASVSENPNFLSTNGANAGFLHLDPAFPTQQESGGVTVAGITTDFDGDARNGTTPDIGADEGNFIANDLTGPSIVYENIPNSICTNAVGLNAAITDASNVNTTAGTKPRLWFKKSTEMNVLPASNTSADDGWKYVEAGNAASPFAFNIDYSLLTSAVVSGDVIEYFVVAQDLAMSPNVGTNAATYNSAPSGVALGAGAFPVSGVKSYQIINAPVSISSVAAPPDICLSGDVTLSLTGDVSTGAEYQWQSSPQSANSWTDIPGATSAAYLVSGVSSSTDFRCVITCGGIPIAASPSAVATVNVTSPAVLSTTPGTACGPDPVSVALAATGSVGADLNWYDTPAGGASIFTGSPFNTPPISTTTTYYVAASDGGISGSVGAPNNGATGTYTLEAGLLFDVVATSMTLEGVYIYPIGTGAGVVNIALEDAGGNLLESLAFNTTGTASPGIKTFVPLNWTIPGGTGYFLAMSSRTGLVASLIRDLNADIVGGPIATNTFMTFPGVMTITSGRLGGTGTSTTYYFFYDWQVSTGCESNRVPVTATISPVVSWYEDSDMDGFGNNAVSQLDCIQPTGYVANNTDCDDTDPLEFPGQTWYLDNDGDDYSDGTFLDQCDRPAGYFAASELIATSGDCNDADAAVNPGATEICNGIDDDCSGSAEALTNTWNGNGNGTTWDDPANWSDGIVPLACQNVVIPNGADVTVPAGFEGKGLTLDVATGAVLILPVSALLDIQP